MTDDRLPFGDAPQTTPQRPRRQVFTVAELTAQIRLRLESAYPVVWIEGELSNSRRWQTGHLYFTLKDGSAQIRGVMFRSALRYLRFDPEDGVQVVVRGRVTVYEPKGEYQLVAEHIEPHGVGARQLAFDQLRRRLEEEGLFDPTRKQTLPALPRKIGIVTSVDGAALRDVMTVLARRFPSAHLVISPTRVQGEEAEQNIVNALSGIARVPEVDVVILTRGGGSVEDLWAFNHEAVARAIAAMPMPVISAVGHETDVTISDFVADLRAPTPSAAAEIVVAQHTELTGHVARIAGRLRIAARRQLEQRRTHVERARHRPGLAAFATHLALTGRHVDEVAYRLTDRARAGLARRQRQHHGLRLRLEALDLGRQLPRIRDRLDAARQRLTRAVAGVQVAQRHRIEQAVAQLESLSPLAVLARGFAVCWNDQRTQILCASADVAVGDTVRVKLQNGELRCEVRETE